MQVTSARGIYHVTILTSTNLQEANHTEEAINTSHISTHSPSALMETLHKTGETATPCLSVASVSNT